MLTQWLDDISSLTYSQWLWLCDYFCFDEHLATAFDIAYAVQDEYEAYQQTSELYAEQWSH